MILSILSSLDIGYLLILSEMFKMYIFLCLHVDIKFDIQRIIFWIILFVLKIYINLIKKILFSKVCKL